MADEITPVATEEIQTPELSPVEQKAAEAGWVPEKEWDGDPDAWRPAKEFLDRGELFRKIEDQNRTIKEFKRALNDLQGHHKTVKETEYTRALQALKQQKKTALEDGDADSVIQLDDQIDLVKNAQRQLKAEPAPQDDVEINPTFANWTNRNKWYETDAPMRAYADALGRNLAMAGMKPDEVLVEVERQVKQEFSSKFRNPNRDKVGVVEGSSSKGGRGSDSFTLSAEERQVMQRFVRTGVMSEKEYIAELKRVKGE